jgi:eukaryotic-like serine/threonine-protein kinase
VAYAHAHQVIHRDLKPANVMVGAFGEVQVMDWGLAKILASRADPRGEQQPPAASPSTGGESVCDSEGSVTQAGSVLGTPAFMAPEQARGEVTELDERSDVFGLGAILAVILTGQAPFTGKTMDAMRSAAQGAVEDCFARLYACGAEPDLVAVCKHCLAPAKSDRPANGAEVARAVAELRAAADDRARRAELAEARAVEQRKRRRLWLGAVTALVLATLGGLAAVLAVQHQANANLEAKNGELDRERAEAEDRFELALKAIGTFHTGASEDILLKTDQFKELQKRLLRGAAGFYGDLEKRLAGRGDTQSRRLLAASYHQLGELTAKIGSLRDALATHRQALAMRRELAAAVGADLETRLDVARSLQSVATLLDATGDSTGALTLCDEACDLVRLMAAESPTEAVRLVLADSYNDKGKVLRHLGKPEEELKTFEQARNLRQELVDVNPANTRLRRELGTSHNNIGATLHEELGKPVEALAAYEKAQTVRQQLVAAHADDLQLQYDLSLTLYNLGILRSSTGKPKEALTAYEQARHIQQQLADANRGVTAFQSALASTEGNIGLVLEQMGKLEDALTAFAKEGDVLKKLADANPEVTRFQYSLANNYNSIGSILVDVGKPEQALTAFDQARTRVQKLVDAYPDRPAYQSLLAISHTNAGFAYLQQKQFAKAIPSLDTGQAMYEKLSKAQPTAVEYTTFLGLSHAYRGWARAFSGQPAAAASDLRRALEVWSKLPNPDVDTRFEKARALAILTGLAKDQQSGQTDAEGRAFADQAVASLQDAVKAGWGQYDKLQEPMFDAIRNRPDFQKLVAELKTKAVAGPE